MKIVHYVAVQIVEELFSKGHLRDISEGANQDVSMVLPNFLQLRVSA